LDGVQNSQPSTGPKHPVRKERIKQLYSYNLKRGLESERKKKRVTVDGKLEHVTVVWVQITHVPLLRLRHGGTLIRVISSPVLQNEATEVDAVGDERETDETGANTITRLIATAF